MKIIDAFFKIILIISIADRILRLFESKRHKRHKQKPAKLNKHDVVVIGILLVPMCLIMWYVNVLLGMLIGFVIYPLLDATVAKAQKA